MLNNLTLVGRLTREPEFYQKDKDATPVVNYSLAFNQGFKADGSEDTGFIDAKSFGKLAETINKWLSKGDKVAVSGRIAQRKFQRKDGSNASVIELIVDGVEFIDVLKAGNEDVEEPNVEELPFEPKEEVKLPEKPVAKPTRRSR